MTLAAGRRRQVPIVHAGARIDPEIALSQMALSQYAAEAIWIPARRPGGEYVRTTL
jgi:hypothetical protein